MAADGVRVPILDHGYLSVVEYWGSDERVVEAARMSTGKGFLGWESASCSDCAGAGKMGGAKRVWKHRPRPVTYSGVRFIDPGERRDEEVDIPCATCNGKGVLAGDVRLLAYLRSHRHTSPFELAGMVVEVQAPIMVFREWHRHRTQSYAEMSARYTPLPDTNYVPTSERCLVVPGSGTRQATPVDGASVLTHESALEWLETLSAYYELGQTIYLDGLDRGVPKELARLALTVGRYSRMRAQAVLKNWLDFLTLRMDATAQHEIRQYAGVVADVLRERFPRTMALFDEVKR